MGEAVLEEVSPAFSVKLSNFEGPFDLLLQLISRHKLDVTEVALSVVTDEFISYIQDQDVHLSMDQTSQFLVVAATLLDLKAARLLPQGEVEDEEDLAALQARDLLFARLLQYRAFKIVSQQISARLDGQLRRHPRPGGLEDRYAKLLPEVDLSGLADHLAYLAAQALTPKTPDEVPLAHLHVAKVSVAEQAGIVVAKLKSKKTMTFRALVADAPDRLVVVGRFLALLELFRALAVTFEQLSPLGDLTVNWVGGEHHIESEFDEEEPHD
ncbi:MAG: segregation/condensation protein A [Propionibacteriaceae bacterium]|nr:segregation/condensation protein A [Propionibacteriaceae bacterium]